MRPIIRWSKAVLAAAALAVLPSCSKPLPAVGKDHILNYFPIESGKALKYRCYGKPWKEPWKEKETVESYEARKPAYANGKFTADRIFKLGMGSEALMETVYKVEVSPREVLQQEVAFQAEGMPAKESKGPLAFLLKLPPPNGKVAWRNPETKVDHTASFGKTGTSLGKYDDCLVVDNRWDEVKPDGRIVKHHIVDYYQRGIGLVKREVLNPDGSLDVGPSLELANP